VTQFHIYILLANNKILFRNLKLVHHLCSDKAIQIEIKSFATVTKYFNTL